MIRPPIFKMSTGILYCLLDMKALAAVYQLQYDLYSVSAAGMGATTKYVANVVTYPLFQPGMSQV